MYQRGDCPESRPQVVWPYGTLATSRKVDMKSVLTHLLGPLPWSLGNCDGTLKKTSKSTLAGQLGKMYR